MSDEINEKIHILEQRHYFMTDTWEKRKILYDQNLDTQVFILYYNNLLQYYIRTKRANYNIICWSNYFKYDSRSRWVYYVFSYLNVMQIYWSRGYKPENPC